MRGPVTIPFAPRGRTVETMRALARRRFFLASIGLAFGSLLLSLAAAFLLATFPVGSVTVLVFGALLQILGCAIAAQSAVAVSRGFPLSEPASTSRRILLASVAGVLPAGIALAAAWMAFVVRDSLLLLPALPLFWGPLGASASVGLVFAARDLASERMTVVAALGAGGVAGLSIASVLAVLAEPVATLTSARLVTDLFLIGIGFLAVAAAFERDAWAARSRLPI